MSIPLVSSSKWPIFLCVGVLGVGCFGAITLPPCDAPPDCPAGYVACDSGFCLTSSDTCDAAAPVAGDGCCFVSDGERGADDDCVGLTLDLEGAGFAGPALDPAGGAAYVTMLRVVDGDWQVWLTRVQHDGTVAWRVPVGPGTAADLAAPVATDFGAWVGFSQGARAFDRTGAEIDVTATTPSPGQLAALPDGRLAWLTNGGASLVVRGAAASSREHAVALPQGSDASVGPVFASGGERVVVAKGTALWRRHAADGAADAETTLDQPAHDLAVSNGRLYVLEGRRQLGAFVLASGALPRAWRLPLPRDAVGQVLVADDGRVVLAADDGHALLVDDQGDSATVRDGAVLLSGAGAWTASLLADGWLIAANGSTLQAARIESSEGAASIAARWRHALGNPIVGGPLADADAQVWVLDGAGRLRRLVSGAPGAALGGWPTVAGATALGGAEAGITTTGTDL